ncbi:uncharacterized protein LOC131146631 [Malania oleifera]|uniref:uncharacterized protein LOC131146631 n=1 Tax=Malania oleifera TaxID=397392 RepID=UPI0025AE1F89|nr:uncharacterized protein LOC131146631 [Malania oleifera]
MAITSSIVSALRAYWLPLILFSASLFFQLIVIPSSFPPSHYEVLGIARYSSIEEVTDAYEKLLSKWNSGVDIPNTGDFIKIRYAFELLTNPLWKRNYDIFGIDEQLHVIDKVEGQYAGRNYVDIDIPLLKITSSDVGDNAFNAITSNDFGYMLESNKAWLILLHSLGSSSCAQFADNWKRISALLDGVANTGTVEIGEVQLATYLAEKRPTGQPFFRNGLPSLVVFPMGCNASNCLIRYEGELSVDAVTDWFATTILSLPRILYYSKETLVHNFLAKASPHKVKVIFLSRTGERATPFLRQAARDYWNYASFAFVLWQEEESFFWWNAFKVESAPAIVILKDSGVKPLVHHGSINSLSFLNMLEQNKQQELPQLRSVTSMELGCDPRGSSRAGNDTMIWYCVILAGRHSPELNKMRGTMRRVQEVLSTHGDELNTVDKDQSLEPLAIAVKKKRLTFTWLDGEMQKNYCFFYLNTPTSYETCGPRKDPTDVPQLLIVRYKRDASQDKIKVERKKKSIFYEFQEDVDAASQLVARYNGTDEISQIIQWISQIIKDGDSSNLPSFRAKTPELIPEDADPLWSRGAQSIFSTGQGLRKRIQRMITGNYNHLADPRIGPILLLGALMSSGSVWLRNKSSVPSKSNRQSQPIAEDEVRQKRVNRRRTVSSQSQPSSITDVEPKDAFQMPMSDSDSE